MLSATLAALAALAPQAGEADAGALADFEDGLVRVEDCMRGQDWKSAQRLLSDLLEEHAGRPYVLRRRFEIEEGLERILFWLSADPPKPKQLVSGKLVSYSPSTGQIRLRYGPDELGDFIEAAEGMWIHPLRFSGDYSVTVKGKSYAPGGQLLVGLDFESAWLVHFGGEPIPQQRSGAKIAPAVLVDISGAHPSVVDTYEEPPTDSRRFTLKVSVDDDRIRASHNRQKLLDAEKDREVWGSVGYSRLPPFDTIEIAGRAQRSWIQNLVDAANQARWQEFHAAFDVNEHLPEWLRRESVAVDPATVHPGEGDERTEAHLRAAYALEAEGKADESLDYLLALDEDELPGATREYALAVLFAYSYRFEEAREHCSNVLQANPDFVPGRVLEVALMRQLGRQAEARDRAIALLELAPDNAAVYAELARLALSDGDRAGARDWVDRAREALLRSEELDRVHRLLVKAESGPNWDETHVEESEHYRVHSDIDRTTCRDAAKVLERAYRLYEKIFGEVRTPRNLLFDVYVFSGKASFDRYADGTLGFTHPLIAGLYSSTLKQLLIWNLPAREDMLSTVRHEGFHQYLDRFTSAAPRWFNEGFAEYAEAAEYGIGRWTLDEFDEDHAKALHRYRLKSLRDFLTIEDGDFLADPGLHYALSYAFVFFLRHSSERNGELFTAFFDALRDGVEGRTAIERVFDPELERLEREFRSFLRRR